MNEATQNPIDEFVEKVTAQLIEFGPETSALIINKLCFNILTYHNDKTSEADAVCKKLYEDKSIFINTIEIVK